MQDSNTPQESSINAFSDNYNKSRTIVAKEQEKYTQEQLKTLAMCFDCDQSDFEPLDDKSESLSHDELVSLVNKGNYGDLSNFNTQLAHEAMTEKQFVNAALIALCDNNSYFTYSKSTDILYCNVVGFAQKIALVKGENLFASSIENIKENSSKSYDLAIVHAYLLYLAKLNKLDGEGDISKLFLKKDIYKDFFEDVIRTLSQIFIVGLNNINFDLCEKIKALYIQASSYRINFLKKSLHLLYDIINKALEDKAHINLNSAFNLICRIINTIEAMSYQNDRDKLIALYGLNEDHEYIVDSIHLIGCHKYKIKELNDNTTNYFYFYDFLSRRFLVIKTIESYNFKKPTTLFGTNTSLTNASKSMLTVNDVFITDNKLTNSAKSCFTIKDKELDLDVLYDIFAYHDFEHLKEFVYDNEGQYFVNKEQTQSIHLIKVKKAVELDNEANTLVVSDSQGHELKVYLNILNANKSKKSKGYKISDFSDCYMLVKCPIISGLIHPIVLNYFD